MYAEERGFQHWRDWPRYATTLGEVPVNSDRALFYRQRNSHEGISARSALRLLKAAQVNQGFLGEICSLQRLEYLCLETVTASDLAPLANLENLHTLKLDGVRSAEEFGVLLSSPRLERLFIEHAPKLRELGFLSEAHELKSLGVEGSLWTKQTIESLAPLAGLRSLEALFMTSTRLVEKDLSVLASIPNLRVLECARFAPEKEFRALRKHLPHLECKWCDRYDL